MLHLLLPADELRKEWEAFKKQQRAAREEAAASHRGIYICRVDGRGWAHGDWASVPQIRMVVVQNSLDVSVTDADVLLLQGQAALRGNQVGVKSAADLLLMCWQISCACTISPSTNSPSKADQQSKCMGSAAACYVDDDCVVGGCVCALQVDLLQCGSWSLCNVHARSLTSAKQLAGLFTAHDVAYID
jgi:hypothetical protein